MSQQGFTFDAAGMEELLRNGVGFHNPKPNEPNSEYWKGWNECLRTVLKILPRVDPWVDPPGGPADTEPTTNDTTAGEGTPIPNWPDRHMLEAAMGLLAGAINHPFTAPDEWVAAKQRWMDAYHRSTGPADTEQTDAQRMVTKAIAEARSAQPVYDLPITAGWEQWWREQAEDDIRMMAPKVESYGARDLIDIGRDLAYLTGRRVDDMEAALIGILFYARGKLARWMEATREGRVVPRDTLLDLAVYARMAQRVLDVGGWPNPPKEG